MMLRCVTSRPCTLARVQWMHRWSSSRRAAAVARQPSRGPEFEPSRWGAAGEDPTLHATRQQMQPAHRRERSDHTEGPAHKKSFWQKPLERGAPPSEGGAPSRWGTAGEDATLHAAPPPRQTRPANRKSLWDKPLGDRLPSVPQASYEPEALQNNVILPPRTGVAAPSAWAERLGGWRPSPGRQPSLPQPTQLPRTRTESQPPQQQQQWRGDARGGRSQAQAERRDRRKEASALSHLEKERGRQRAEQRGEQARGARQESMAKRQQQPIKKEVKKDQKLVLPRRCSVRELAGLLEFSLVDMAKAIIRMGYSNLATIDDVFEGDDLLLIATQLDFNAVLAGTEVKRKRDISNATPRPPIVSVMGHVDHGKTTLLDALLRRGASDASLLSSESGGITQHLSAFTTRLHTGQDVTFMDTPGHAAFSSIRMRGSSINDVTLLVVACDDGVNKQTRECVKVIHQSQSPCIVVLTKRDLLGSSDSTERVRGMLVREGVLLEGMGGSVPWVEVSAKTGQGLDDLEEMIELATSIMELAADANAPGEGTVLESWLDKHTGVSATLLVEWGTLKVGDYVAVGEVHGRVRQMTDFMGKTFKEAGPSTAVTITGLKELPQPGSVFNALSTEKKARQLAERRRSLRMSTELEDYTPGPDTAAAEVAGEAKELETVLPVILRADVSSSLDALTKSISQLPSLQVEVRVLDAGIGQVTESDVDLAAQAGACIYAFGVAVPPAMQAHAANQGVSLVCHDIIYSLLDAVTQRMLDILPPQTVAEQHGTAAVVQTFTIDANSKSPSVVAGCVVKAGSILASETVRVVRDGVEVFVGPIKSLRHLKDRVQAVETGKECGIVVEGFQDVKPGDVLECVTFKKVKPTSLDTH